MKIELQELPAHHSQNDELVRACYKQTSISEAEFHNAALIQSVSDHSLASSFRHSFTATESMVSCSLGRSS